MDPTFRAFLQSWDWRLDIIVVLLAFGLAYTAGWLRLRRKGAKLANRWRLGSYYLGLVFLVIALMSGIDTFQTQLFFIHMVQHVFLFMLAPPLLLLANPMPFLMWAIPGPERRQIARLFTQRSRFRKMLVSVTTPTVIWFIFAANLWLWHDPNPYNAAITNDFLHDIEHWLFFITGLGFWWHVTNAAPKFHRQRTDAARMALIIMVYFQNLLLGVAITMSPDVIYTHYESVPRVWGISVMQDQMLGGLIMWIPGGMMYLIALLILIARMIDRSERRARMGDQQRRLQLERVPSR
ncbi:MAG: cytochrome c oxidase assembly protein [Chloroflexi bacterium]|nr:cytochrome c oxidase assembly protein [Chloroflexota bacterium]